MMNRKAVVTIALTVACLTVSSQAEAQVARQQDRIHWANSPEMAMSVAHDSHLPILAFITSKNCRYCRKMERVVWSNPRIIAQVEAGFVPVMIHVSQHRQLIASLGIRMFPTTILFTPEGTIINQAPGYMPPNRLAGLLHSAQPTQVAVQPLPSVE